MKPTTLLATAVLVLTLNGCASSHVKLNPDGTISGTLEVIPGTSKPETVITKLETALNEACAPNGKFVPAVSSDSKKIDSINEYIAALEKIRGFLGKTTVTLSGRCE